MDVDLGMCVFMWKDSRVRGCKLVSKSLKPVYKLVVCLSEQRGVEVYWVCVCTLISLPSLSNFFHSNILDHRTKTGGHHLIPYGQFRNSVTGNNVDGEDVEYHAS